MPMIFSPGEAETRPLDPNGIVYTTAQKVADFLSIGPQEEVLVAQDSTANAVYVTGADYRAIGYSVGDTLFIYSDADPLGLERVITSVATNSPGVQLNFADSIAHANYQVADNAYVQNTASFTEGSVGRTRGMTKSIVETRIKEVQDKIDNLTHNAWRPYLVTSEYINFDTYKPYRRRYYTDYVGTAPLLFRNVQQILRLELWQGDDYREIAAAEGRIHLPDDVRALSGSVVMSPGNGTAGVLTIGTGTNQWRADFDSTTTAQNLADLINKEDRVSKATVEFAPAFTLEGSTANVGIHNEFFATANSDYGTGKVKFTSLRQVKAGETCSIVSTDSNITLKQTTSHTATFSSLGGKATGTLTALSKTAGEANTRVLTLSDGTKTVNFAIDNSLTTSTATNIAFGNANSNANQFATNIAAAVNAADTANTLDMSAVASDATVTLTQNDDGVAGNTTPSGTAISDSVITLTSAFSGGQAANTINVDSTAGFTNAGVCVDTSGDVFRYTGKTDTSFTGCAIVLGSALSSIAGTITQDLLVVDLQGGSSSGDSGRLRDWWLDHENGIIYFNNSYPFFEWNAIKCSYIYGERYLEKAIEEAATKMVAIDLLLSDDRSVLIPEGTQNVDLTSKIQLLQHEVDSILSRYKEIVVFE